MIRLKNMVPDGLFARSLLILVLPVILIQVISAYVFYDRHWDKMTSRLSFAVAGEIGVIADYIEEAKDPADSVRLNGYAARSLDLLVTYKPGATLSREDVRAKFRRIRSYVTLATLSSALDKQVHRAFTLDMDDEERWVQVGVQLSDGVLHVSLPQRRLFSSSGHIFLMWMFGVSTILLIVAVLFMRNQIRPIRKLAVAAERFGRGLDIPSSYKPSGAREIRQAARAFLDMQGRITRQIQQRTAMLAGVSHDLRTPLTRMKLQVAMLKPNPDVDALKTDILDMERMIDAYLDFARGEGGEVAVHTDMSVVFDHLAVQANRLGFPVQIDVAGDMNVLLRPVAFERCLSNLINNARKYASKAWITARRNSEEGTLEIFVDDNGPGIPESMYEEVFKPFVRGEPSRNPNTGGVGLGLPIAQDIVHSHGGNIWLDKSQQGGLRVGVVIPA